MPYPTSRDMDAIRGRCVAVRTGAVLVRSERATVLVATSGGEPVLEGDLVEVVGGALRVVGRPTRFGTRFLSRVLDPRRLMAMEVRDGVEQAIRAFFRARGFRETRTPLLVPCPGMEPHVRPFRLDSGAFLPTSPELAMKRLLVGGLERIFQICPAFRNEPVSERHHPEFTMLEWYRAFAREEQIMEDVEALVAEIAVAQGGGPTVRFQGRTISVAPPWPRLMVRDLFAEHAGLDLPRADLRSECARLGVRTSPTDTRDDLYFRIWLERIEPRLPADRAVFVTRYPASQAALAVVDADPDGSRWARRFEVYAGGMELGNAFEELTDPAEQRRRFEADMEVRKAAYGDSFAPTPIDEDFLAALEEGMPPSAGIAMGVDRLAMLFADEPDIDYVMWLPGFVP